MNRKFYYAQSLVLFGGSLFSWTVLMGNFSQFYSIYGTIFRFRDCYLLDNPMLTPCFYGAVAFVVALIWSLVLTFSAQSSAASQKWLSRLLLFGVVFAISVLSYETAQYYKLFSGPGISCTPGAVPWKTPCFFGAIFFIVSFGISRAILNNKTQI